MATSLAKGCLPPCSENTCPPLCAAPECWEVKTLSKRMTSPACRLPSHHCPWPPWSGCFPISYQRTQFFTIIWAPPWWGCWPPSPSVPWPWHPPHSHTPPGWGSPGWRWNYGWGSGWSWDLGWSWNWDEARLRLMFRMRLRLKLGLEFRLRFEGLDWWLKLENM